MKKSKKILFMLLMALTMILGGSITALAKENTISVLAEADVPEDFTGKVIVNYEGEDENNKISIILSQDNNYQQMYELKKDNYTLSGKKVERGSLIEPCTDFSLIGADTAQTYSLAFKVSEEELVNDWSEDEMVEVSFEADVPEDFEDTMEIVYEGQDGYVLKAFLNEKNNYTEVVKATKTIFVKSKISTQETYSVDYLRGFTLENATNDNVYVLQFKVGEAKSFKANFDDVDNTVEVENTQATGAPADVIFKLKGDATVYEKLANTIITIEFAGTDGSLKKVTADSTNGFMANVSLTGNEAYDIVRVSSNLTPDDEGNCEYNFTTEEARFTATADKVVTIVAVKNENYSAGFSLKDIPVWAWIVLVAVLLIIILLVVLMKKRKKNSPSYVPENEELVENFDEQEEEEENDEMVHREPQKEKEEVIDLTEDTTHNDFFEENENEDVSLEEEQQAFRNEAENNMVSEGLVDEPDEEEDADEEENEDNTEISDSDDYETVNEEYQE